MKKSELIKYLKSLKQSKLKDVNGYKLVADAINKDIIKHNKKLNRIITDIELNCVTCNDVNQEHVKQVQMVFDQVRCNNAVIKRIAVNSFILVVKQKEVKINYIVAEKFINIYKDYLDFNEKDLIRWGNSSIK